MLPRTFNPQPELENEWLALRPLRADDEDRLHAAAADPETWAGHPAKDRFRREVFAVCFRFLLEGRTTLVIVDKASQQTIGCSRYYAAPDQPGSISIGFTFLSHAYWGGATNKVLKCLMLDHAFTSVPEVWFHIAPTNIRSQKATAKLGAEHIYDATLDLSGTLALWKCYRLTRETWAAVRQLE